MINIIDSYEILFKDESLIYTKNLAYQKDRTKPIEYAKEYFDNYVKLQDTDIAIKLNQFRISLTEKYCKKCILDIGIGSGEFISKSKKLKVFGFDINPYGIQWLHKKKLFLDPSKDNNPEIEGISLWDTLEHMPNPTEFLDIILPKQYIFISIPTFDDFKNIKNNKHYKPNEHYFYFSVDGFINFMQDNNFNFIEKSDEETKIGRNNITSFVFIKN